MFSKLAVFAVASFAVFVAALPYAGEVPHGSHGSDGGINYSCNTGPSQCCNSFTKGDDPKAKLLAHSFLSGNDVSPDAVVGLTCSANILGSSSCGSQAVCCENNSFDGVIAIGCSPINVGA